jgi:hypothetical protein
MLRDFQALLSAVYALDQSLDVYDYLVTDARQLARWEAPESVRQTEEKLLVHEFEDEMGLLLYLDADLLDRLTSRDPRHRLGRRNFADFCTAVEGVSHLIYLAWNAAANKSVTLMELEMQAEVDKYIGARLLLDQQPDSNLGGSLFGRLFDDPGFDEGLAPDELERYRDASNYAGRYCRSLEKRFPPEQVGFDMIQDLRAFYRLPQPEKVSHIQSAFFA